jgi:RNA 2',3'-cyclic 3'-phosphodiesterase
MRLFVGLDIPDEVRREVRVRLDAVRAKLPPARWVDPAGIHLTLVFLGEVEEARLPDLEGELARAAAAHPSFKMALFGGGTFPPRRAARVAWIGVEAGPALAGLQGDVAAACEAALPGWHREERPYNPHVTLARCPENWPRAAAEVFAAAFAGSLGGAFPVGEVILFRSRLGRGGARYEAVGRFPLAPLAEGPAA